MHRFIKILVLVFVLGIASTFRSGAQKLSLSTNLADTAFMGTLNAEAQYAVGQNWTLAVSGGYNPWTYKEGTEDQMQRRRRNVSVGARWWPWHVYSGWWVSGDARWQEYNEAHVFTKSVQSEEGDRFGFRLGAGYSVMLTSWFNIDFGFRGWGGYRKYTVYACQKCGTIVDKGHGAFILPDEAVVALMFVF